MIPGREGGKALAGSLVRHREHFVNFSSSILLKVITFALYFLAIPFFISHQGNGEYGVVAFLIAALGYSILLDNGITYVINLRYARSLSLGESDPERIVRSGFPVYLTIGALVMIGGISFSENISNAVWGTIKYKNEVAWLSFALALQVFGSIFSCTLLAHNRVSLVNGGRLVADVARVIGLFSGAVSDDPILISVLLFGVGALCKMAVDIYNCNRLIGLDKFYLRWCIKDTVEIIKASPMMWTISFLSLSALMYDKWYVSSVLSSKEFAYYSVANDFTTKAYFIFYAFSGAVYTPLIRKYAGNDNALIIYRLYAISILAIGLFYYLPLFVYSDELMTWYIGVEFAQVAAPIMDIMVGSALLYLLFNVIETNLYARGTIIPVLGAYIVGVVSLLVSLPVFVERYGIDGGAWSVMLMLALMLAYVSIWVFYKIILVPACRSS